MRAILAHGPWPVPWARDPSNRVSGNEQAIAFGERLFHDRCGSPDAARAGGGLLHFAATRAKAGFGQDALDLRAQQGGPHMMERITQAQTSIFDAGG